MTIEPDVRAIAKDFGIAAEWIQAVVIAEGNIVKAVQMSVPSVQTRDQALRVTARSIAHALSDYVFADHAEHFVDFFGGRWAPVGAANDPKHLNEHWAPNVKRLLGMPLTVRLT